MEREKPLGLSLCAARACVAAHDAGGHHQAAAGWWGCGPAGGEGDAGGVLAGSHPSGSYAITEDRQERGYVPTVGRWGCEWPSKSESSQTQPPDGSWNGAASGPSVSVKQTTETPDECRRCDRNVAKRLKEQSTDGQRATRYASDIGGNNLRFATRKNSKEALDGFEEGLRDLMIHQSFFDDDDCLKTKRLKPRLLEEISTFDIQQLKSIGKQLRFDEVSSAGIDDAASLFEDNYCLNSNDSSYDGETDLLPEAEISQNTDFFDFENSNFLGDLEDHSSKSNNLSNESSCNKISKADQLKLVPYKIENTQIISGRDNSSNLANLELNFPLNKIDELNFDLPCLITQNAAENLHESGINKHECVSNDITSKLDELYCPELFDQKSGPWPVGLPLPIPCWGPEPTAPLVFASVIEYEAFASKVEMTEQRLLEETNYDTVDNFLKFSDSYRKMRDSKSCDMRDLTTFFRAYTPPVSKQHHTCVSLAMELLNRLKPLHAAYPKMKTAAYLVSCEEAVGSDAARYVREAADPARAPGGALEKEHALVAMRLDVAGRRGVLLCDPGYHVARVVTVMADEKYPHTGWFTQCDEGPGGSKREYNYAYSPQSSHYVEWTERQHRTIKEGGTTTNLVVSLVYVQKPYRTAVDVTVRRNLVYNFRSLLSRDTKGQVVAGLYFLVSVSETPEVTLFYEHANVKRKTKYRFAQFSRPDEIPEHLRDQIDKCSSQLKLTSSQLTEMLSSLSDVMIDHHFIRQLLDINDTITEMTADN